MVDNVAAFIIPCCVHNYLVYHTCGLHLLERSLLLSGTWITQVISMQNTTVKVHAAHCAALALRGMVPCEIFLNLRHFLILRRNVPEKY